jgi:hypothetical protein
MFLLHLLRWLRANTTQEFDLLLGRGGPLESEFAKVAEIHAPKTVATRPEFFRRFGLIYSNTCCNGNLLETLPYGDVPIVTHLHELDYGIDCSGAKNFAGVVRQSNHYIACAQAVAERLRHRFRIPAERISVHYEAISLKEVEANVAAESPPSLRKKYDIPENAFVLSACGTFDQRKAPDLFVQLAGRLQRLAGSERPLRFFWIGKKSDGNLLQILQHDVRRTPRAPRLARAQRCVLPYLARGSLSARHAGIRGLGETGHLLRSRRWRDGILCPRRRIRGALYRRRRHGG